MKITRPVILSLAVLCLGATPALTQENVPSGETLFKRQCASCHTISAERNGAGPHLVGIAGRPAASVKGFKYSAALLEAGITWDAVTLDRYLSNPGAMVKGTRMSIRVADESRRHAIVQFLTSTP